MTRYYDAREEYEFFADDPDPFRVSGLFKWYEKSTGEKNIYRNRKEDALPLQLRSHEVLPHRTSG